MLWWFVLACSTTATVRAFDLSCEAEDITGHGRLLKVRGVVWQIILAGWGMYLASR